MMNNYSKFFIIFLIFNFEILAAQTEVNVDSFFVDYESVNFDEELYVNHQKIRMPPIQELSILDSTLIFIIDTVLQQEKECTYFSKKLCLGLLFSRCNDTLYNNCYYLKFELCDKNTLLSLAPIGYFLHQGVFMFVYDIVGLPKELFSYSGSKKDFNYYTDYSVVGMIDDRYSMYFYWYINNQFYYEESIKCAK